jgi:hypothetical protein
MLDIVWYANHVMIKATAVALLGMTGGLRGMLDAHCHLRQVRRATGSRRLKRPALIARGHAASRPALGALLACVSIVP